MPRFAFLLLSWLGFVAPLARAQTCTVVPLAVRSDPGPEFQAGCAEYVLNSGGGAGAEGSYAPLDLSALCAGCTETGSAWYRCAMVQGVSCCLDGGACLPFLSGNMSGSTASAIQERFARDTDQREATCYSEYHGNGSRLFMALLTGPPSGGGSLGCSPAIRPATFFLTRIPPVGSANLLYCNFIAAGPVAAVPTSWGNLKLIYR